MEGERFWGTGASLFDVSRLTHFFPDECSPLGRLKLFFTPERFLFFLEILGK